jgi:hypothetical protein
MVLSPLINIFAARQIPAGYIKVRSVGAGVMELARKREQDIKAWEPLARESAKGNEYPGESPEVPGVNC